MSDGHSLGRGIGRPGSAPTPLFADYPILCLLIGMVSLLLLASFTVACQKKSDAPAVDKKLIIVTTLFPLYDITKNIAGDGASVSLLLPPGAEPHSFEPKPGDMLRMKAADMFIYTGNYMEPWSESFLKDAGGKKVLVVDASKGIPLTKNAGVRDEHGKADPHVWLDLSNTAKMVDNILEGLIRQDAGNRYQYSKNAVAYKVRLNEIDVRYQNTLSTCKKRLFIHGGHFAFGYLANRYGLQYVSAYQGSPDAEPTPRRLIELKNKLKQYNIHYVFYEELIMPRIAEVISKETGAALLKLHGAHNISKDEMGKGTTFLSIMEENLKSLRVGLECQ